MNLREAVKKGLALKALEGDLKWEWGDLLAQLAPASTRDVSGPLRSWYGQVEPDQVGIGLAQCFDYRTVAIAWPKRTRRDAPWRVHYELREHADRKALLDKAVADKLTVRQVRVLAGKKPYADTPPASVEDKARLVEEVLASDEGADVMERVLDRSTKANANISRASDRVQDRRQRQTYERHRDSKPDFVRAGHLADADRLIAHAARDLEDAIAQVQAAAAIALLVKDEQAQLDQARGRLLLQADALNDVVATADKAMEDELLNRGR